MTKIIDPKLSKMSVDDLQRFNTELMKMLIKVQEENLELSAKIKHLEALLLNSSTVMTIGDSNVD